MHLLRFAAIFSCTLFVPLLLSVSAKAQDNIKLFAGYSYLRPSLTYEVNTCPMCVSPPLLLVTSHPDFHGYEFSATYKPIPFVGVTADFSGHYGTVMGTSSGHVQTYLVGPEVSLRAKVSPFAHALFGVAHETVGSGRTSSGASVIGTSGNAFATALGAGIDLHVAPFVSVRALQVDYLGTRFGSKTQNQPRVSAGVVLHF